MRVLNLGNSFLALLLRSVSWTRIDSLILNDTQFVGDVQLQELSNARACMYAHTGFNCARMSQGSAIAGVLAVISSDLATGCVFSRMWYLVAGLIRSFRNQVFAA